MEHQGCLNATERLYRQRAVTALHRALADLWEAPAAVGIWVWYRLLVWQHRASARHALQSMDDRQLNDVGLRREQINAEASKPFWRA
jgi:uncharacterized protein YjiS (DUF1127 family)